MRFLHLSDLHLGMRLHEQAFLDDQKHMLNAAIDAVKSNNIDCVFIAGDVYDKQIPAAEAITVFDSFISELALMNIPVFISSGNHDSTERLSFGSSIMSAKEIYVTSVYNGNITPITVADKFGEIDVYMIPFIKPANVRRFFDDTEINSYTDAMKAIISTLQIDNNKRNILICHQNVGTAEQCENVVGGLDMIDAEVFEPFNYVALGHIHKEYHILKDCIRYSGTVLCYDFNDCENSHGFIMIDMNENGAISKSVLEYTPLHPMMKLRGRLEELIALDKVDNRAINSYLYITLTDEQEIIDSVGRLRSVYPFVLSVEYDNARTQREQTVQNGGNTAEKTPYELYAEFYEIQNNAPMNEVQADIVMQIIEEVWGDNQ